MKVLGQLEKAQLEQLATDPAGAHLYEGRVWVNTTDNITRYYDGSAIRSLADSELIGVTAGDGNLGSFTGSIITDDSSVKTALQELETSIEPATSYNFWSSSVEADNAYTLLRSFTFTTTQETSVSLDVGTKFSIDDDVTGRFKVMYNAGNFPYVFAGNVYHNVARAPSTNGSRDVPSALTPIELIFPTGTPQNSRYIRFYMPIVRLAAGTHTIGIYHAEGTNEHLTSSDTWISVK